MVVTSSPTCSARVGASVLAAVIILMELKMSVRLKLEDSSKGLVATISQRDEAGKVTGRPATFVVGTKKEAKERAKTLARTLGLKTYGIVDKTVAGGLPAS